MSALATIPPDLSELLPEGYDLTSEDGFIQAGVRIVELGRACLLALGELLAWKLSAEGVADEVSRTRLLQRYAGLWGVSVTSLVKALVNVERFPEIERPQDVNTTVSYEVLSGAATPEDAEAGFDAVTAYGWGAQQVREAKFLRSTVGVTGWQIPTIYFDRGAIWARASDGREVRVATVDRPADDPLAQAGFNLLRYRGRF